MYQTRRDNITFISVKVLICIYFYGCTFRSNTGELTKLYRGMPHEIPQDFTRQQSEVTVKLGISHYRVKYRNKPEGVNCGGRSAALMVFLSIRVENMSEK